MAVSINNSLDRQDSYSKIDPKFQESPPPKQRVSKQILLKRKNQDLKEQNKLSTIINESLLESD